MFMVGLFYGWVKTIKGGQMVLIIVMSYKGWLPYVIVVSPSLGFHWDGSQSSTIWERMPMYDCNDLLWDMGFIYFVVI